MRKIILLTICAACGIFLFYRISASHNDASAPRTVFRDKDGEKDNDDGIREAMEMEFEATKDVTLGYVPKVRLAMAVNNLVAERRHGISRLTNVNALTWTERGPNTDVTGPSNGNTRPGNGATSGRIRAIWVDLADATHKTVWIGGVDGGIWKTTDITSPTPNWAQINDFFGNLSISSICQNPVNTDEMYFGTGEKAQSSFFIVQGGGIWKSSDHGANWSLLPSTTNFFNISKIVCDGSGNLYVSVVPSLFGLGSSGGVYRSSDGGNTWTNITPTGLSLNVTEMKLSGTGRLHIVCGYSAVGSTPDPSPGYRYTDAPSTVTSSTGWNAGTGFPSPQYNCELAVSGNSLYALNSNSSFQTPTVYKSTDGGTNWAACSSSPPTSINSLVNLSSGQAWYNMEAVADPANGNNVIVGGLNAYRSTDGGATWTQASVWVGTTGQYIHADQHTGVWNGSQVLIGCDGGIFYSADGGVTWQDRNTGLRLKQFYSCAIHPSLTNYFLAGAQDNGTHQLTNAGLGGSTEVTGGDGAFTHIDQDQPQYQFGSYTYNNYRRSSDGGNTWDYIDYTSSQGQFINPTDYDDGNNKMYASGAVGQYIRWEDPQTGNTFTTVSLAALGSNTVRAVTVSPYTSNRVFFGTAGGRVVKADNANTNSPAGTNITGTGMPTTLVSCVALGTDDNNLIATYSNYGSAHVWISTTGGGAGGWTNISGNLPDIPVRWAMFYPDDNTKAIIATEMGVFETGLINGASTIWTADPNFPTVLTSMLQFRKSDGLLAAATHGRGLWTTTIPFTTPAIHFSSAYRTQSEGVSGSSGCRNYKDYTVDMTIDAAPAGDAGITISVDGSSTATRGVDYDFTTNGDFASPSSAFTFTNGVKTSKTITIRVYDDANIESTESVTLNYSISGTTNAVAAPSFQSYTFTITDNDVAPVPGASGLYTIGTASTTLGNSSAGQPFDARIQSKKTQVLYLASELTAQGITAGTINSVAFFLSSKNSVRPYQNLQIQMGQTATSFLWNNGTGTTNLVSLSSVKSLASYSTVTGWNTFTLDAPFVWDGTSNIVVQICYDNGTAASGDLADVVSGYFDGSASSIGNMIWIDNQGCDADFSSFTYYPSGRKPEVQFQINSGNPVESTLNAGRSQYVGDNSTFYFYTTAGNILGSLSNASANLGCVSSSILETGNTWQSFFGGQRSGKAYTITPSTNSNASYTVSLYYTAAELAGKAPATLKIVKTTAPTIAGANAGNTVLGNTSFVAFGSGYVFTASFTGFSNFFLGDAGVILPVTLLNFDGHLNNTSVILNWSTSLEQNSRNFDIEKSTDGLYYNQIGSVPAAGNSNTKKYYSFTDNKLSPANYYRLRMNDMDGRNKLSEIVLIRYTNARQQVWVLNNPFDNYIDIGLGKNGSRLKLQLINMNGNVVAEKTISTPSGQIRWNVPAALSKGSYVIKASIDSEQFTYKLIKK